ncbi:hypothetical protein [Candidatus Chromulinivorax destructor]|uniref:CHAT domain-containing protein n=1 Tax=Candidatus Chromulinivorax destructor TaxID=2066483 RepID=A0A345ZC87_9BACT|nr:hypothetical protein [Candidatus Chromulinivorax destructor]AXK60904.1 hypothetical protein C0J27_04120 [Candidatus Chromulinivorax destructor]
MKKLVSFILLLSISCVQALPQNLILLSDCHQQEGIDKDDITATHQLITALQQATAPIIASTSLWKNIVDRKQAFTKKLQDQYSLESEIYRLYQATNKQLQIFDYNLDRINKKLSLSWYAQQYSKLALLQQDQLNKLKFNFLCYSFNLDFNTWSVYDAKTGMFLFVPLQNNIVVNKRQQISQESDLVHDFSKKNSVIQSLQVYFSGNDDEWVIYASGHGNLQDDKEEAMIAGMSIGEFSDLLSYFDQVMKIKLFVYSSCYAGGVHTVEPYKNKQVHFPVIVVSLTDCPIYGFGFFEGVKLPPYTKNLYLTPQDIARKKGLLPCKIQDFQSFFRSAWSGQHDLHLIGLVSQFFSCDDVICSVKKIENMPLVRKAGALYFNVFEDEATHNLMHKAKDFTTIYSKKAILLYTKKIEKIVLKNTVSIISMLPGLQNHQINELIAQSLSFSQIVNESFLSLADAAKNKNYLINRLVCKNDIIAGAANQEISHCMIIQQGFMPKFLPDKIETCISFAVGKVWYLIVWKDQKPKKIMTLTHEQINIITELEQFMQQGIDVQSDMIPDELLTFDAYVKNKVYQNDIIESCLRDKICR